jgi:hypothetical protein
MAKEVNKKDINPNRDNDVENKRQMTGSSGQNKESKKNKKQQSDIITKIKRY